MWFADRQDKGFFTHYFQKQVINYKSVSQIDREFHEQRKGHS